MQKKRSRKNGTASADGPTREGRRVRVRSRLVVGVAVAGLTVLAAGTPAVVSATRELNDSQRLVTLAQQSQQALTLAHLLGDERDAVVEYVAKGRPGGAKGPVDERTGRTDRQIGELKAEADEDLTRALGKVAAVRAEAVDGKGSALAAHQAYAGLMDELLAPGDRLAELTPPRAEAALAVTRPLTPLGRAVEQAAATRGLLLAALAVPRGEQPPNAAIVDELTTASQRARVREQAALDDFARAARPDVRQTLAATVTGPEVKTADDYLKRLTDRPVLTPADRKVDAGAVGTALTARVDRMRSVESTLAGQRANALATLRDDDVTRLELLVAGLGVLFLFVVGFSTAVARSLTRPLSVLRRGAERLTTAEGSTEPVRFTGRNDEFAEVVRHLNAVRDQTVALHTRVAGLDADRRRLIGRNEALSTGREALESELASGRAAMEREIAELRAGLEEHRRIMSTTSVSLSLRTLGLVERQLAVIEDLESKEGDPDRLATLFKLDHLATVMRRHNENLLVLAGQEHGHGQSLPVPLVDVMRAAVSEIERYERVDLAALPSFTQVAGHAADDISHVLAELLENATTFSPPDAKVKVSGRVLDSGDVTLSVVDTGIGVTEDRLASLNARLSTPDAYDEEPEAEHGLGLGLYVAGRLAARHGVTAELRAGRHGGTEALVVIPAALLPATPPVSPVHSLDASGLPAYQLPGVVAEANENTLPPRLRPEPAAATDTVPAPQAGTAPDAEPDGALDLDADLDADADADADLDLDVDLDMGLGMDLDSVLARGAQEDAARAAAAADLDAETLPPADQVFTALAPEAEAEAEPEAAVEPEPAAEPTDAPDAPEVPDAAEELLARVVPDPDAPEPTPEPVEPLQVPEEQARVVPLAEAFEADAPTQSVPVPLPVSDAEQSAHRRAADADDGFVPRQGSHPGHDAEAVTDKGLPKRTPRAGKAPVARPAATSPEPPRRVDAEELRRRLGGFYQGAQDGRRVVAAELAREQGQGQTDQGDTAQEART
ncbi:nitrate- and nitrite sensing domain-containing protein [Streptomyces sp. RerS4]|uniref:sensor histidine kinase n=1 Tax=Streptomyces sp. RerS4 TaxID=2942449 RepID=UPI00201BAE8E|nr:nitrate- and nitrite sensing domain-containing protein [Streptomyces sp. RerS4]UQX02970.1 nitrate- and nitrite sensing domain-containing protein [Streptomyces sp. RerS4]